jgi:hypothetical protein
VLDGEIDLFISANLKNKWYKRKWWYSGSD